MKKDQTINLKGLRSSLKDYSVDSLDLLVEKILIIRKEKQQEQQENAELQAKKRQVIEDLLGQLKDHDISLDEVSSYANTINKADDGRSNPQAKYSYTDLDGVPRTWTGRGKVPVKLRELMQARETTLEMYRIDSNKI